MLSAPLFDDAGTLSVGIVVVQAAAMASLPGWSLGGTFAWLRVLVAMGLALPFPAPFLASAFISSPALAPLSAGADVPILGDFSAGS